MEQKPFCEDDSDLASHKTTEPKFQYHSRMSQSLLPTWTI